MWFVFYVVVETDIYEYIVIWINDKNIEQNYLICDKFAKLYI